MPVAPIETSIDILATPADVWAVVSDMRRMTEWSPEVIFQGFTRRELRKGTRSINLNKFKGVIWPTLTKITEFEPEKKLSFYVAGPAALWMYLLEPTATGTRLIERREINRARRTIANKALGTILGGTVSREVVIIEGMNKTLARIKAEAETV